MNPLRLKSAAFVLALFASSSLSSVASAQDSSVGAAADTLFKQGRQLYDEKKYAEACPKFAESVRLDPASGALLALASCHEAQGKLASAWAEYNDTAARARRDGQAERADTAQKRAQALEPKLAKLNVVVAPEADVPGLQIKRDGVVIAGGALGTSLPVDKGEHVIEASAPGFQPFNKHVTLVDGASLTLNVPRLSEAPKAADPSAAQSPPVVVPNGTTDSSQPPPSGAATSGEAGASGSPFPMRTLGIVAIAGGVVSAGVGTFFGVRALGKNSDSNANNHCVNDVCDATGRQTRLDARSAGNVSTALFAVGGILVAGGIVLVVLGKPHEDAKPALAAAPLVAPGGGGLSLNGSF